MNKYEISNYTYGKALQYGYKLRPSLDQTKLIDVCDKHNNHIISIGNVGEKYFCDIYLEDPKKALLKRSVWAKQNLKKIREISDTNLRSEEYYINLLLN